MRRSGQVTFLFFLSLFGYLGMFSIIYFYLRVLTKVVLNWYMFHLSLNAKYLLQSTTVNKWDSPGKWHSEFFLSFWISWQVFNNLFLSQSANNGCFKLMYVQSCNAKYLLQRTTVDYIFLSQSANKGYSKLMCIPSIT